MQREWFPLTTIPFLQFTEKWRFDIHHGHIFAVGERGSHGSGAS